MLNKQLLNCAVSDTRARTPLVRSLRPIHNNANSCTRHSTWSSDTCFWYQSTSFIELARAQNKFSTHKPIVRPHDTLISTTWFWRKTQRFATHMSIKKRRMSTIPHWRDILPFLTCNGRLPILTVASGASGAFVTFGQCRWKTFHDVSMGQSHSQFQWVLFPHFFPCFGCH